MVRAKFYAYSITHFTGGGARVELLPVFSTDPADENKKFWDATPTGKIEMHIKGEAAQSFVVGQEYYVDFSPAAVKEGGG